MAAVNDRVNLQWKFGNGLVDFPFISLSTTKNR
jgi:hypothetical protein